jgi:hypothetical protein
VKPIFPGVEELLALLVAELPDGVYAADLANDADPAKRSYSSAELRAMANLLGDAYENLAEAYADKFISTVTPDGLAPWEKELFTSAQDATRSFEARKQNLLAKRRANGGISLPAIRAVVAGILDPVGLPFAIVAYSGQGSDGDLGAWILDESPLDRSTWLGLLDPLRGAGRDDGVTPLDCDLDYAAAGLTQQDLLDVQETAYRYEVRIFGSANSDTITLLDQQLTALEPARSDHKIVNNAPPPPDPNAAAEDDFSFGV